MKLFVMTIFLAFILGGCGKQTAASRDAQERAKPGYSVAKVYCSQCHTLPFGDQHPPAAWPYVVSRMEAYMQSAHKRLPSHAEHEAIISYFQSN
jgi:mono/diheme cytochrome c family protein